MADLQMQGWVEIKGRLLALPDKLMREVLDKSLRQGANVVRDAARENFDRGDPYPNEISGWLRRSIRTTKRRGTPSRVSYNVVAGSEYTVEGKTGIRPSYAVWVEMGHLLNRTGLSKEGKAARHMAARIGNTSGMVPPHPFMRPAIEQNAQLAVDFLIVGISDRLESLVRE